MTDITITLNTELEVAELVGDTDEGIAFIDAYITLRPILVIDAGRIIVARDSIANVLNDAHAKGLLAYVETQP